MRQRSNPISGFQIRGRPEAYGSSQIDVKNTILRTLFHDQKNCNRQNSNKTGFSGGLHFLPVSNGKTLRLNHNQSPEISCDLKTALV